MPSRRSRRYRARGRVRVPVLYSTRLTLRQHCEVLALFALAALGLAGGAWLVLELVRHVELLEALDDQVRRGPPQGFTS